MIKTRSLGFITAAILAAGATTAICFGDALGLVAAHSAPLAAGTVAALGASTRPLDAIQHARPWLTAVPGGPQSLRGKVVLVNFWTYSCINSLRALPYLRAWQARYRDQGLVVLGVHAPEFGFEHDPANVRRAAAALGVRYPNLQDNDFAVWRDFANQGWPGFYFIDAKGRVRGYRIGEGDYAESEQLIRKLLAEAGHDPSGVAVTPIAGTGIEAAADWNDLGSPEAYLGYAKAADFRSPGGIRKGASAAYSAAPSLPLNGWDLRGAWTVGREFAALDQPAGALRFRFHARDAHLVLGGAPDGLPVRYRVTIDGAAPGADHGTDIDADGWGEVKEDRLYQLVRQTGAIRDRTITVEFTRPGVRAYVFTFG
ncbi:thiol-disulfide isomerase/thioredoxin [Sphingomonas naasensis]|uniref:Redoxin domain-containing protein n=1 Tax=Sphingomonas naasensis TaxID=1344951 RepID=A0A4S1W4R2_9SPHN|nr:redoxin domain-containing protein [Sphingomonas naasensis]NIJ20667.1 thiol-disulfide isomerase/thioredoxin [Sphingomonas naasensis]TGX37609.1 redoxin domain-containing protein [Sphingomonas naasensis]